MSFSFKNQLYKVYRAFYRNTPSHKRELENSKAQFLKDNERADNILGQMGLRHDKVVLNGPFQGLKYIDQASGSMLLPKLIGSYEEPIQKWIEEILHLKEYQQILDIGCAEGYYAVGFAQKLPNTKVTACDINPVALNLAKEMSKLNQLNNIQFLQNIDATELAEYCKPKTLIFCDIEGYEAQLLNPASIPKLKFVDILLEAHDCFIPGLSEVLMDRFSKTHQIQLVMDYPTRINKYAHPALNVEDYAFATDEKRPAKMRWIYFRSLTEK